MILLLSIKFWISALVSCDTGGVENHDVMNSNIICLYLCNYLFVIVNIFASHFYY